jgi:Concanavalin A-like lectin/glucanases superfamily/Domain of unknown function (DUF5122) beta-propeller
MLSAGLTAAAATTASAAVVADQTLSANASSMWQTNKTVWALAVAGGVVYAGGDFTRVRPPGAPLGTSESVHNRIAAFNAGTGAVIDSFTPSVNGRILDLAVSPDGTKLYLVGAFTSVNATSRLHIARLNLPAGTLDTTWTADADETVATVVVGDNAVYVGGDFKNIKGVARTRIARLSPTSGDVNTTFDASSDKRISESALAPDGSRLLVGGENDVIDGADQPAIASLDPTTGARRTWLATGVAPRKAHGGCDSRVTDIVTEGSTAYVTAESQLPGCWEGVYSADISDGALNFNYSCLGGSTSLAVVKGWLYRGSHNHDCAKNPGGYVGPRTNINGWHRLQVHSTVDGRLGHWTPNTNGGSPGSDTTVGPQVMATDGTQIFVGGDQSQVNGADQQGLTRFGPAGGNSVPQTPVAPVATATAPRTVTIVAQGVADNNDGVLSYRLYRNGGASPIARIKVESWPWSLPTLRFVDKNRPVGQPVTYQVLANDGSSSSARSPASVPVVVTGTKQPVYQSAVRKVPPSVFWRLHGVGTTQSDSSGNKRTGVVVGGVTLGQPGAITGNRAITLNGSTGYVRSTDTFPQTASFTESVWFKTTTDHGGAIIGLSNAATGIGYSENRVIWMDNDGKVAFGIRRGNVNSPTNTFVRSTSTYNDGSWHQAVATMDGARISLYLDGTLVGTLGVTNVIATGAGYLRLGYLDLSQYYTVFGTNFDGQHVPMSYFFNGSLDEASLHPGAMTAAQVSALWAAGAAVLAP